MTEDRFKYLYGKYLKNAHTEAEFLEWCKAIDGGLYEQELEKLADELWDADDLDQDMSQAKADRMFKSIISISQNNEDENKQNFFLKRYRFAAAMIAFLLISSGILYYFEANKRPEVTLMQAKSSNEHELIKLSDGSTVVLNNHSFLKYPASFNGRLREVTLIGEGYFDIKHDTRHPFIVHTGNLSTTVLGTAFNINAYEKGKNITVTVTRGKVSVSNADKVLGVIVPNEQLSFDKVEESAMQAHVNSTQIVQWQSKDIFFQNITMLEAASELEQRFNVKITFKHDAVKKCRFSGTFLHGEKLKDILQVVCDFNNATYSITDAGQVIINGPGCASL
ncbi:FecR family protein [Mucilaginibacter sp. KACC 22063]|uniref:FecR family protein n=1 Tax=Mucilaginibacter sp. KACC 22063 TaxID=3025666 RepID=UPI00236571EA|nr:FecR domain-containing protein [Mucilaginibacter sp. KACC 22063]WDF55830.1 FecR domain-containing protein [Mucilaginibacter sp. KACC 22063]